MLRKPDHSRLMKIVEKFRGLRVAVYGDFVLDEFVYGEIARVSREAPVLILDHSRTISVPGGGANSVNNIKALDAEPVPVGIVGKDDAGARLLKIFKEHGIDTSCIRSEKGYITPVKTRILAGSAHTTKQQIVRMDRGSKGFSLPAESRNAMENSLVKAVARADGLLIADYNHGAVDPSSCNRILAARKTESSVKKANLVVTLDSRKRMLSYRGMTAATPNEEEVELAVNMKVGNDEKALKTAGGMLVKLLEADALLITRGSRGMALFERGKPVAEIPVYGTDEVADVTGAGDTVISTFTLSLLAGGSFYESALIANYAGGIVVMKRGTATLSRSELVSAIASAR